MWQYSVLKFDQEEPSESQATSSAFMLSITPGLGLRAVLESKLGAASESFQIAMKQVRAKASQLVGVLLVMGKLKSSAHLTQFVSGALIPGCLVPRAGCGRLCSLAQCQFQLSPRASVSTYLFGACHPRRFFVRSRQFLLSGIEP